MWTVTGTIDGKQESKVVMDVYAEIKRFMFKNPEGEITVMLDGEVRRIYKDDVIVKDVVHYPKKLNTIEDYALAICWAEMEGEVGTHLPKLNGTTKKQRQRILSRRIAQVEKETEVLDFTEEVE